LTAGLQGLTLDQAKPQVDEVDEERAFLLQDAPEEFVCPLTHELLTDPVVAACGYSYQRAAFEEWVASRWVAVDVAFGKPHVHQSPSQAASGRV